MNFEEKMKQDFCQELIVPDIVDEKLQTIYQQIRDEEQKKKKAMGTYKKSKKARRAAWVAAAAVIGIAVITGSILYSQPSLAKDLPIIGSLFEKIADIQARNNPKDKTAYKQIEEHSEKVPAPENNEDGPAAQPGNIAVDSGVEIRIADAYFDGYDLYYTLSARTEDEEVNNSDRLTFLNYAAGDEIPFIASPVINGTEETWTLLQPQKSDDGSFVQLVRVSMNTLNLTPTDTLDITMEFNAIGCTRLKDLGAYDSGIQEFMGHKTIRGSWKLAFQVSRNMTDNRNLIRPSENQGFIVTSATATPSNLHLTVLIPSGRDSQTLAVQIFDSNGQRVHDESIGYETDETGRSFLLVTADATEISQFTAKVIDKSTSIGDELHVIAEIPFELQ